MTKRHITLLKQFAVVATIISFYSALMWFMKGWVFQEWYSKGFADGVKYEQSK